ncbi:MULTISPECIES: carbonic anhydrase [unclassified Candidatus Frackibacter]|uniref:carbonic anhydrase n=1 Tax=unclassified Candidatus Frackibacter TaxID=2648818 RepID=UPI000889AFFC|nr:MULTISPECIES: carbonic anhydrase [unclassified Candidatus Frackibacter]SDC62265.1 hypothetical protein SAMN04515661_11646 [Candidatus Frackibacter sp. WG11]SEM76024.1 hypothetical protein SAMN04488698_11547 [Candidatus Frackibacter sp. WG12]SFL86385.1 hypothetical protein SAMN04488699_11723 [Candidatus Frackibacter sp. WG13]
MNTTEFVTTINCMDGRVQEPVIQWLKKKFNSKYVDTITEPGPNLILAQDEDTDRIKSIKERVDISVNGHGSETIAIVGHYDCAGNLAEKEEQIEHIKASIVKVKDWDFGVKVIGLWVNQEWEVEPIA